MSLAVERNCEIGTYVSKNNQPSYVAAGSVLVTHIIETAEVKHLVDVVLR